MRIGLQARRGREGQRDYACPATAAGSTASIRACSAFPWCMLCSGFWYENRTGDFIAPVLGAARRESHGHRRRSDREHTSLTPPWNWIREPNKYKVQTDDAGVYQFSNLPAGEYTLTIRVRRIQDAALIKSIGLLEPESRNECPTLLWMSETRMWRTALSRSRSLLRGILFGTLSGSVDPPAAGVEVTLVCRTFQCVQLNQDGFQRTILVRDAFCWRLRPELSPRRLLSGKRDRIRIHRECRLGIRVQLRSGWSSVPTATAIPSCARSGPSRSANNNYSVTTRWSGQSTRTTSYSRSTRSSPCCARNGRIE